MQGNSPQVSFLNFSFGKPGLNQCSGCTVQWFVCLSHCSLPSSHSADVNFWTICLTDSRLLLIYECSLDVTVTSTSVFDCGSVLPCMFSPTWDLRFYCQYVNRAEGRDTVAHLKCVFFPNRVQFQLCLHFTNTNMQTLGCSTFVRPPSGNSFLAQWDDSVGVHRNLLKGCVSLNSLWNCSWWTSDISGSWKTIIMSIHLWLFMSNPHEFKTNWIWCVFYEKRHPVNAPPYQQCLVSKCSEDCFYFGYLF